MSQASDRCTRDMAHAAHIRTWFTHGTLWPDESFFVYALREELGVDEAPPLSLAVDDFGQLDWGGFL